MTTHMPMAATRQPFAPIQGSRLQNLTSLKNRQNALPTTLSSPTKRKATTFDQDDSENIDPIIFLSPKRSKAPDGSCKDTSTFTKPVNFFLTKAPPSPNDLSSPIKATPISSHRPILSARSPVPKVNTSSKSTPLSAPAGRSPTRKRIGILNRRRTTAASSPFTRIDPPKFSAPSSGLGFSIDAALSGSIPSYRQPPPTSTTSTSLPIEKLDIPVLYTPEPKSSWFFDIHEDTAEELATNLMEHSTCTLDISSDEESSARRLKDDRGKENVPPMDDISQTTSRAFYPSASSSSLDSEIESMREIKARARQNRRRKEIDENAIDIDRSPLGALAAEDFYAEGCDGESVFLIPSDPDSLEAEEEECEVEPEIEQPTKFDFAVDVKGKGKEIDIGGGDIESLMTRKSDDAAALLQPIEKAEEGFQVWESGSAKGDE